MEDYPEDALNKTEAYYIFTAPEKYKREKIEKLLGRSRDDVKKLTWDKNVIQHAIDHIELLISERSEEEARKAQQVFDAAIAEARSGQPPAPSPYSRTAVYPELSLAVVTIKGHRYRFWRDPESGRFAKVVSPEQIPERAIPPKELERK